MSAKLNHQVHEVPIEIAAVLETEGVYLMGDPLLPFEKMVIVTTEMKFTTLVCLMFFYVGYTTFGLILEALHAR